MSYLTNNVGLNLNYNCEYSVMIGQGINQVDNHQAWVCVVLAGCPCNLPAVWVPGASRTSVLCDVVRDDSGRSFDVAFDAT
jgi:hypothetical protein